MATFSYRAGNAAGETLEGTIEASDINAAQAALAQLQLKPIDPLIELPSLNFTPPAEVVAAPVSWPNVEAPATPAKPHPLYLPITETLRLYAGWLLAWYLLVYALGAYQSTRQLPFRIPYVEAFLPGNSALVLTFALACFWFLLFTTLRQGLPKHWSVGFLVYGVMLLTFAWYRANV